MKINIHLDDSLKAMESMPDKKYGLAIVDPPYGISAPKMSATPCQRKNGNKRLNSGGGKLKNRKLNKSDCEWDNAIPTLEYFIELNRISNNRIIWGGNYFPLPPTRCMVCWDKVQPWENFSQIELAWTSFDSPARIYKYDNRTGGKIHPTQKPIQLYKWLLKNYGFNKDGSKRTIFDSHGGSLSIVIACIDMGFDIDIWEIDPDYYRDGVNRVKRHLAQQDAFREQVEINIK